MMDFRFFSLFFSFSFFFSTHQQRQIPKRKKSNNKKNQVIVGAILGGSALLLIPSLLRDPASVYRAVGGSLSNASNFFVNYLETQALLMAPFRLLWPCSVPLKVLLSKIGRGVRGVCRRSARFCSRARLFVFCCCCRRRRRHGGGGAGRRKKKENKSKKEASPPPPPVVVVVSDNGDAAQQEAPSPPPPLSSYDKEEKENPNPHQHHHHQQQQQRRPLLLFPRAEEVDRRDDEVPRVSLRAGREVGGTFFQVAAVALSYGAVAPLALPFAALWCALSWIVWRLQILYAAGAVWK